MLFGTEGAELAVLDFIQSVFKCGFCDRLMTAASALGNNGGLWIAVSAALLCTKKYRRCGAVMALGLLIGLFVFVLGVKNLVMRPRPFMLNEAAPTIIAKPTDFSFPSGHTLTAFSSAFILFARSRRLGTAALAAAALIAFSRMYLYVHFPTDILGGIAFAALIFFALRGLLMKTEKSEQNT